MSTPYSSSYSRGGPVPTSFRTSPKKSAPSRFSDGVKRSSSSAHPGSTSSVPSSGLKHNHHQHQRSENTTSPTPKPKDTSTPAPKTTTPHRSPRANNFANEVRQAAGLNLNLSGGRGPPDTPSTRPSSPTEETNKGAHNVPSHPWSVQFCRRPSGEKSQAMPLASIVPREDINVETSRKSLEQSRRQSTEQRLRRELRLCTSQGLTSDDRRKQLRALLCEARRYQQTKPVHQPTLLPRGPAVGFLRRNRRRSQTFDLESDSNFTALMEDINILMEMKEAKQPPPKSPVMSAVDGDCGNSSETGAEIAPYLEDNYEYTLGELMSLHLWSPTMM